jgi:hypothetical protein
MKNADFQSVAKDVWTLRYPLSFFGMQIGRCVTLLRLGDGHLLAHSSGPFTASDLARIKSLGRLCFIVEATTMHDTFTRHALSCYPNLPFFLPEGFPKIEMNTSPRSLSELAKLTSGEILSLPLEGTRYLREYACFHFPSKTLILGDLLFNLNQATGWTRWVMRYALGVDTWPAIDRPMRMVIRDKQAFERSIAEVLRWDFCRIVVAHGSIIEIDARAKFEFALSRVI